MNDVQKIQLERVRVSSFNNFDGELVARDLAANEDLWTGFVWGRFQYFELIELRDIPQGYLNADTLMILTTKEKWEKLSRIVEKWHVDEVGWAIQDGKLLFEGSMAPRTERDFFGNYGAGLGNGEMVVRLWWD